MRIAIRSAFWELVAEVTVATVATEVVSRSAARTLPSTRTGGQDDGSYTNSLKIGLRPSHRPLLNREINKITY